MWLSAIDRWARELLPQHQRADVLLVMRARVGVGTALVFALIALVRVPMLLRTGPVSQALLIGLCALLAVLSLGLPRFSRSFTPTAHVIVGAIGLAIVGAVHRSGGAVSPALFALMLVPLVAVFMTGRVGGIAWGMFAGGVILGYALLDRLGLGPRIEFAPETWKQAKAGAAFVLTMASLGLTLVYDHARKRAEQEAEEADRRLEESEVAHKESLVWLSASLAHEANNTLAYVMADLEALGEERGPSRGGLARVGAERLRDLVKDVGTLAASAQLAPEHEPTDLVKVCRDVLHDVTPLFERLGIEVSAALPSVPVWAVADAHALARCLAAALGACSPEAKVEVAVDSQADQRVIRVTSRGGLLEARPLAVAAARRVLGAAGGSVETDSEGASSTLRISLRAARLPAPVTQPVAQPGPVAADAHRLRVLVLDDEPAILITCKRLLARHEVCTSASPREALALLEARAFDVVICDFNMPELRGDEILRRAMAGGFDPRRFVLMTGGELPAEVTVEIDRLQPLLLAKPYTRAELEATLQRAASA